MALNAAPARTSRSARRRWLGPALGLVIGAAVLPGWAVAAAAQAKPTEYQLKAVFLFNFAQFTTWPDSAFAAPDAPLVIGVLGNDPFGKDLDAAVRGERVNGHPLVVQRYGDEDSLPPCHILFVSRSERERLAAILHRLGDRAILTVSDLQGFADRGGMLQFIMDRDRIRLRANLAAVNAAHLQLSSKLLRAAEIVTAGKD
jgi:hypothetical protein